MNRFTLLITGASSGIGRALAEKFAEKNCHLFLFGRDLSKLNSVKEACEKKGATADVFSIDITDREKVHDAIVAADQKSPIDLVIANAGMGTGQSAKENKGSPDYNKLIEINILGVHHTLDPLVPRMKKRGFGQVAVMSSLAGFRGFSKYYVYNATKAYTRIYGQGLRLDLKKYGIKVSTIAPGFVKTPLTDQNPFKMPLIMSPEKAAKIIVKGLRENKSLIAFPKTFYFLVQLIAALPLALADKIAEKIN